MTSQHMHSTDADRKVAVRVENGEVRVDSRDVAVTFERRHDHVVHSIDEILAGHKPENMGLQKMFILQTSAREGGGRPHRSYTMNRDGFALLVMGFNGKQALTWKLRYIAAFNAMEAQLRAAPADPARPLQLSRSDQNRIRYAKLELMRAVDRLDELGIDIAAIDMDVVLNFARSFRAMGGPKPPAQVTRAQSPAGEVRH